jgi:hypothetical protein
MPKLPPASPKAAHHRSRIGGLKRQGVPETDPRYAEARQALQQQVYADKIARLVAKSPPLTEEQLTNLYELLAPIRNARREAGEEFPGNE